MVEPEDIQAYLTRFAGLPKNFFILPWHTDLITMRFMDQEKLQLAAAHIDSMVQAIDQEDPWVKQHFGKTGPGEGLVLYPLTFAQSGTKHLPLDLFAAFVFKAKGSAHQVVKTKSSAEVIVPNAKGVEQFVDLVVTEARLLQGLEVIGKDVKKTGEFVNWVKNDVQKETQAELEASNLNWKEVLPIVTKRASTWFVAKLQQKKE